MNDCIFTLGGATLHARPSGALHWPDQALLVVSDLHIGKSERLARRGGPLLPPYETHETLERLDGELAATAALRVICLGDSFDDAAAAQAMGEDEALWLSRMMAGRNWTWIAGNHDPAPLKLGGTHRADLTLGPLTFRHIADPASESEVSGHYHPKATLAGRSRPCFLLDRTRLILPAFGAYTGGLRCTHPALMDLMQPDALAILTGTRAVPLPMPRRQAIASPSRLVRR